MRRNHIILAAGLCLLVVILGVLFVARITSGGSDKVDAPKDAAPVVEDIQSDQDSVVPAVKSEAVGQPDTEEILSPGLGVLDDLLEESIVPAIGEDEEPHRTYGISLIHLREGNLRGAVKYLKKLVLEYSSSGWYGVANLTLAYAYYQDEQYNLAVQHAQDFLALNPRYARADFVQYLIASSYYEMLPSVEMSTENAEIAQTALQNLISRYPDSIYVPEAEKKLAVVKGFFAEKVMNAGRNTQREKNYIAALHLFTRVIDEYSDSVLYPEALYRVAEIYYTLGVDEQLAKVVTRLERDSAETSWYERAKGLLEQTGL